MATHFSTSTGKQIPLAGINDVSPLDVTDARTIREKGKEGNVANDFLGGAPETVVAGQIKYYMIVSYRDGGPAIEVTYATAALRNTDVTDLRTAMTT